ncbi:hypothetical protein Dimus_016976 [Dionaea muscipula]
MDEEEFFLNCGLVLPVPPFVFEQPPLSEVEAEAEAMPVLQPPPLSLSSPAAESDFLLENSRSNSPLLMPKSFLIRELLGKLGNICNSAGDISPVMGSCYDAIASATSNSCYANANANANATPPLSSPHTHRISSVPIPIPIPIMMVKDQYPITSLGMGNSISIPPLASNLPAMPGDPGFADRAARFSSFGSGSFNGLTSQFKLNNTTAAAAELPCSSGTLPRVSSSPCSLNLKVKAAAAAAAGSSQMGIKLQARNPAASGPSESMDNSSKDPSDQENGSKRIQGGDVNPRKRKATIPKGRAKEVAPTEPAASSNKVAENGDDEDPSAKRTKVKEGNNTNGGGDQGRNGNNTNAEKEEEDKEDEQHSTGNQKPSEPPKDYIHVRARRGQATDSHSLAERVRREKISERMKLLQDLVPGCNKVTGKALMLDEIINYVQSLQKQVEFLSMKLATVNPGRTEYNVDTLFTNKIPQPSCSLPQQTYPLDSSSTRVYCGHQPLQNPLQTNTTNTTMTPSSMDPLHATDLDHDNGMQLPLIDGLNDDDNDDDDVSQLPPLSLFEDDLQAIVDMGFGHHEDAAMRSHTLHGPNQIPLMKIEF